jgi:hypothetical protein
MSGVLNCAVCNTEITDFGHNPDPINSGNGRVCDICNIKYVMPARMADYNIYHEDDE